MCGEPVLPPETGGIVAFADKLKAKAQELAGRAKDKLDQNAGGNDQQADRQADQPSDQAKPDLKEQAAEKAKGLFGH